MSIGLTLLLFLLFSGISFAQNGASALAVISDIQGSVYLNKAGGDDPIKVVFGTQLVQGDQVV